VLALLPLAVAAGVPSRSWLAVPVAIALLPALGIVIGRLIHGRLSIWGVALATGGIVVTAIGVELRLA
jgi:putative Ca2+/H+ antiporter (TMEM165/GDT1 family)